MSDSDRFARSRFVEAHSRMHAIALAERQIFGTPDDLKFRSSVTLFELAGRDDDRFGEALDRFCGGIRDERTLALLARHP